MMRSRFGYAAIILVALAVVIAGLAGCRAAAPMPSPGTSPDVGQPGQGGNPPPSTGGSQPEAYPKEVTAVSEALKAFNAGSWVADGDQTFFLASLGPQNKSGAEIKIADIKIEGQTAVVTVKVTEPTGSATQPYSPVAVKAAEGTFTDVFFQRDNGDYFARLVGAKGPLAVIAGTGNVRLTEVRYDASGLSASGFARVFEATVSWEVRDSAEKILTSGFTNAASGGPDWGWFQIKLDSVPTGAAKLAVFWNSPKDGAPLDVVEVPIQR